MPGEEELLSRQMPHSTEAEQSVLGSMLIDARCVPEVIEALKPEDFYLRTNREIYETIYSMFQLMEITPTAANVKEYVAIVKDKALLRRIAETAGELTALVQEGTGTGQEVLEAAEQRIYAIRQGRAAQGLTHISSVILGVYERLNELAASDQAVPGLSTGLPDVDMAISGLNKSDLILLAARPGMGKTSFALNLLLHAGKFGDEPGTAVHAPYLQRVLCGQQEAGHRQAGGGRLDQDRRRLRRPEPDPDLNRRQPVPLRGGHERQMPPGG